MLCARVGEERMMSDRVMVVKEDVQRLICENGPHKVE